MDIEEWKQGRKVWAPIIGHLLLAFGEIEYCLMICLGPLDSHMTWSKVKDAGYKRKVSEAIRVLSEKHPDHIGAKNAIQLLNDSLNLVKVRNLVAHNPLNVAAYTAPDGDVQFRLAVGSLKNHENGIIFQELEDAALQAEALAAELHDVIHDIWISAE